MEGGNVPSLELTPTDRASTIGLTPGEQDDEYQSVDRCSA